MTWDATPPAAKTVSGVSFQSGAPSASVPPGTTFQSAAPGLVALENIAFDGGVPSPGSVAGIAFAIDQLIVEGAGTAAANGNYSVGEPVNGRPAWYHDAGTGYVIQFSNVGGSPYHLVDSLDVLLYYTVLDDPTALYQMEGEAGTFPAPTVSPNVAAKATPGVSHDSAPPAAKTV